MLSQVTPPPSSSTARFTPENPAAAPKPASSKRKHRLHDPNTPATTKQQVRRRTFGTQNNVAEYVNLLDEGQVAPAGASAQLTPPPVPFAARHDQHQHHVDLRDSPLKGRAGSNGFLRAVADRLPGDDGLNINQGQAVIQSGPSDPAQQPRSPHSDRNHNDWAYEIDDSGTPSGQQSPWTDPNPHQEPPPMKVQPRHHAPWMTSNSISGPHHVIPQSQGQPMTDYGHFRPSANFPGHDPSHPVSWRPISGTAFHPIVVDDTPKGTTSRILSEDQQLSPHLPPVCSMDCITVARGSQENVAGLRPFASISTALTVSSASDLLRPVFSHSNRAVDRSPSGEYAPVRKESASPSIQNPDGSFDHQPGIPSFTRSNEYYQTISGPITHAPVNSPPAACTSIFDEPPAKALAEKSATQKIPLATDEPSLCPEQAALVNLIMQGHNVFYTGSAGCGKSTVLKAFVKKLTESGRTVRIVAPTGRAALNFGGMTTWTFAGWTPNSHKKNLERLKTEAVWNSKVSKRLWKTDVLVIDEISMIENLHFERLNEIMKAVHHKPHVEDAAFGGCQIVVTGDFCQLPPVKPFQHCMQCGKELMQKIGPGAKSSYSCNYHDKFAEEDKWAFRSKAWEECDFKSVHLRTIHRQNDEPFIRMLQKCRLSSRLSEQEIHLLMNHKNHTSQAIDLYPTRKEADDVNRAKFNKIAAEAHTYWAHDSFFWHKEHHPNLQWKGVATEWRNASTIPTPLSKRPLKALEEHRYNECV